MDESERQKYEEQSKQLRADLKRFEADWASHNGGSKPRRDDIKKNPDIGKYCPSSGSVYSIEGLTKYYS